MLVLGSALLGALVFGRGGERVEVVMAARDIAAGATLTAADVRVVDLPVDTEVVGLAGDEIGGLPGLVAVGPISAGSLLHPEAVSAGPVLGDDVALVSAVLVPGAFPVSVQPGSRVLAVGATGALGEATVSSISLLDVAVASGALVALEVDESDAEVMSAAAGDGDLRLVLLAGVGGVGGG